MCNINDFGADTEALKSLFKLVSLSLKLSLKIRICFLLDIRSKTGCRCRLIVSESSYLVPALSLMLFGIFGKLNT